MGYHRLTDEQWQEFKREMKRQGVPFKAEERNPLQQLTWTDTFQDIANHGSLAAAEEFYKKQGERWARQEAIRDSMFRDWTEEYGRSRKVGDKVLLLDTAWHRRLSYDDPRFIIECLQELTIEGIKTKANGETSKLYTSQPRKGRSGTFHAKSGKNSFEPTGQACLVIPAEGFDYNQALKEAKAKLTESERWGGNDV